MAPVERSVQFLLRDEKRNITLKLEGFFGTYGNMSLPGALGIKPPVPREYDPQGALSYVITVLLFYGFSIVFIIILLIKKKGNSRQIDKEVQDYHKALVNVDRQCKKERKASVKRKTLRRSQKWSENAAKGDVTYTKLQGEIDMDTSCASLPTATPGTSRGTSLRNPGPSDTPGSSTPPSSPVLSVTFSGIGESGLEKLELEKKLMQLTWISETSLDKLSDLDASEMADIKGRLEDYSGLPDDYNGLHEDYNGLPERSPKLNRLAPTRRTIRRSANAHPWSASRVQDGAHPGSASMAQDGAHPGYASRVRDGREAADSKRKRSVTGSLEVHYMPASYYIEDSSSDSSLLDSDTDTLSALSDISEESDTGDNYEYDNLALSTASSVF